ncbi:MAG: sulfurtransferase [Gammaproteobacteria bacterium]|jgi:rhodanese-related sulfurtransferase|nr:sulfurtransferase [Gammaproteobacteria bacterium]MBU2179198.1 sulfurtransferase [Gammaproteobacteria bacterium]MBU2224277.1 sulfurtransferase [Gammaproteobacteria bacterium]MBU2280535.1 sulfurtransferase [Gammaproteobacteria bacterium]MBU2427491.1 sulfurtransferase [Gammaproteobacteria bacterium]
MSKQHNPGFLTLVDDAKSRVKEITIEEFQQHQRPCVLIDVREDREWQAGHLPQAMHLGKGIIERDIEAVVQDKQQTLVLYCGGGFRSALAGDVLQKMGYTDVLSLAGGYSAWVNAGLPLEKP